MGSGLGVCLLRWACPSLWQAPLPFPSSAPDPGYASDTSTYFCLWVKGLLLLLFVVFLAVGLWLIRARKR